MFMKKLNWTNFKIFVKLKEIILYLTYYYLVFL